MMRYIKRPSAFPKGMPVIKRIAKFILYRVVLRGLVVSAGSDDRPFLSLTFDDGPHPVQTLRILKVLERSGMRATFFVSGENVEKYPALIKAMVDGGHEIGNHFFSHVKSRKISYDELCRQIERTADAINRITGVIPKLIRPPYGELSIGLVRYAITHKARIVLWSVDSEDSFHDSVGSITARVDEAKQGDIVLLHEDYAHTADAISVVAGRIMEKGLSSCIVSEIVEKRKEVVFVLQYFYPEVASTAQLMTELAEYLVSRGLKVRAVVGQPTYTRQKTLPRHEIYRGIEIERVSCTRFEKNSSLGRMMNWASYTALVFLRLLFMRGNPTLFIVSTPPFLFAVGYLLNLIRGQEYICLVYDLYPDIAERLGYINKGSVIARVWDGCNKRFFKRALSVIVPGENMKKLIDGKLGEGSDKVKVIPNWADGSFIKPLAKSENWFSRKYNFTDKLTVLYAGNMGLFHQLETLVEAADKLRSDSNIQFVFIGEGGKKNKLTDMVTEKGLENVLFLPYQDKDILPFSLTSGDISVVSLEKSLDCVAAPCKLYTSLAAGQIILGLVDKDSDVAKVVNGSGSGFCVAQDDVEGVVAMLTQLSGDPRVVNDMKSRARKCFEGNFEKDKSMEKYHSVISKKEYSYEERKR